MSPAVLTASFNAAIAELPPEIRQAILDQFVRELHARDERLAKIARAAKMKAARVPTREIARICGLSLRDIAEI